MKYKYTLEFEAESYDMSKILDIISGTLRHETEGLSLKNIKPTLEMLGSEEPVDEDVKMKELHEFVVWWMINNEIRCEESIHQCDNIQEQLTGFACHCFELVESELPEQEEE